MLSLAQAAEMLNASQTQIVMLIERGDLPHHMIDEQRRVRATDLIEYRDRRDRERSAALAETHRVADDAGMDL